MTNRVFSALVATMIWVVPASAQQVYTICSGEYERACQPHEVYVYCYVDLEPVATGLCKASGMSGKHEIVRLNTYGGHHCGYSIDRVICK